MITLDSSVNKFIDLAAGIETVLRGLLSKRIVELVFFGLIGAILRLDLNIVIFDEYVVGLAIVPFPVE